MTRTQKALFLMDLFDDPASKIMIYLEWAWGDPAIELRFEMATRRGDERVS